MNKTDSHMLVDVLPSAPSFAPLPNPAAGRLLVVMVEPVGDEAALAGRIHALAAERRRDVLLVGVCASPAREPELRRSLALLTAFVQNTGLHVETAHERGADWMRRLLTNLTQDDLLACCADTESRPGIRPVHDALSSQAQVPVIVFERPEPAPVRGHASLLGVTSWIGSLAIILGFLWLQMRLSLPTSDALSAILLILSIVVEISLIWIWNSLTG